MAESVRWHLLAWRSAFPILLLLTLLGIVSTALVAYVVVDTVRHSTQERIDAEHLMLLKDVDLYSAVGVMDALHYRSRAIDPEVDTLRYAVYRGDGRFMLGNMRGASIDEWKNGHWRILEQPSGPQLLARNYDLGVDFQLVLAQPLKIENLLLWRLIPLLALIAVIFALASFGWIVWNTRRERAGINAMNTTIALIGEGRLQERVSIANQARDDEIDKLARRLNELFDRNEALIRGFRQLSGNVAHELAAPIIRILDLVASIRIDDPKAPARLEELSENVDNLHRTFGALLEIYEMEGGVEFTVAPASLGAIVAEVEQIYAELLYEDSIAFSVDVEPVELRVNYWLFVRAITNLIDNALRYTPPSGQITLTGKYISGAYQLVIRDSGTGTGAPDLASLLRKLVRSTTSKGDINRGLGLRIVHAIALRHGVRFEIRDTGAGTCAEFIFPLHLVV